jgi:ABC-2 type transport system permease protein
MSGSRIAAVVLRQLYLMRGSPARVIPLFVWVAVDVVLWGFITTYLDAVTSAGFSFMPVLLGAVLLWDFLVRVMQGVTIAFFEDVWTRNFLNIFATPLSISEYLAGLVFSSIVTSSAGLVVMLVLATAFFGLSFLAYGPSLLAVLLVLFLFGTALGIFSSAVVLRLGPASEWLIWPVPALISPFVGVFYPLSVLPEWMRLVSHVLPPSYVFEGLRALVSGGTLSATLMLWGASLSVFYIVAACWCFARMYRHAVQTGLIARYSAETVS